MGEEKEKWEREWKAQKVRVQKLVKESKEKWEQDQAREVWTCKNRGKQLWKHINKLRGKGRVGEEMEFYKDGKKLGLEEAWEGFIEHWIGIYQKRVDNIMGTWEGGWSKGLKGEYEEELRRMRGWEEQMDMPVMSEEILIERVGKLKKNKAAGPDMVRGEVLQEVIKSKKCREALVVGYNGVAMDERIPSSWDKANTRMIGKGKKRR